jgi:hypothetical protein
MTLLDEIKKLSLDEIEHIVTIIAGGGILIIIAFAVYKMIRRNNKLRIASMAYEQAQASGNKQKALLAGRKYYGLKSRGKLTANDELAIQNDLSVM